MVESALIGCNKPEFEMNEKEENSKQERPVAGMPALGLGAFCAFGVFVIAILIGMSSVLAGKPLLLEASSNTAAKLNYEGASQELYDKAVEKIFRYRDSAGNNEKVFITLGHDELNSLICFDSQFKHIKDVIAFKEPSGDKLVADISFPLERLRELDGEGFGKFLNGEANFYFYVRKRELKLQLQEVRVNGEKLQIDMLSALGQINLLTYWNKYEAYENQLNLVADTKFEDGRLHLMNWKEKKKK